MIATGSGESAFKRYRVVGGCLCRARHDLSGGEIVERLANFNARIEEELVYDDGTETATVFVVSGWTHDGHALGRLNVAAREFTGMSWVMTGWGCSAVIEAGAKDHLRAAILTLSKPRQRRIFRRTGWIERGGEWAFLYQGGAIGAENVEVELDAPLDRFRLPERAEDVPVAIRTSLSLLDCGPLSITMPLFGAVYLAPLAFILKPDVAIWCFGQSGALKSELASLVQAHFGAFDRKTLPANWASTAASLEARLNVLADVLVTIDDFAPQGNRRAQGEMHQRAERILRSVGNQSSRARLRGDLASRPDRPPRGLVLSTGESLPVGHSINARLVAVEIQRSRLNFEAVTRLQETRYRLPHALRAYLDWLQIRIPELRLELPLRRVELRAQFRGTDGHLREGDALAHIFIGVEVFARFAVDSGALSGENASRLLDNARAALLATSSGQAASLARADPAQRFMEVLSTLLTQRRIYLDETIPPYPAPAAGTMVGFRTSDSAMLLPRVAYRAVASHLRARGERWAPAPSQLHATLVRKGCVVPSAEGRAISQHRVGNGRRPRVLKVPLEFLPGLEELDRHPDLSDPTAIDPLAQPTQPTVAAIRTADGHPASVGKPS